MSSSLGGGGFGGSQGQVRYAIIIDDSQVNSKLQNFQSRLGQLDSATRSSGSGLTTLNNNFQTMDTNLQNTGRDLDAINNNFRSMDSSIQSTTREMGALNNNFQGASGGLTQFNTLQGQAGDGTRTLGDRMRSAGGFIKDNALAIGFVGTSVINLVSSYTQLQKSQVAADRANILNERSQQKVVKLQDKLNKLIADGKQGTTEYNRTLKDLQIAQDFAGVAAERAGLATATAAENAARFIPQLVTDIVGIGAGTASMASGIKDGIPLVKDFASKIKELGTAAGITKGALLGVGTAIGVITGVAAAGIAASALISKSLKESSESAQKLSDEGGKWLDDLIGKIPLIGPAINDIEQKFSEFLLNTFPMLFTEQDKAFIQNRKLGKSFSDTGDAISGAGQKTKDFIGPLQQGEQYIQETDDSLSNLGESATTTANGISIVNRAIDYQLGRLPGVSSAADEYAMGIDEVGEKTINAAAAAANYNRAIDYQLGRLPGVTSAADEYAMGIDEAGEATAATSDKVHEATDVFGAFFKEFDKAQEAKQKWLEFVDTFNAATGIKKALGIEYDVDKFTKDLVNSLPNKLEKKLKLNLKMEEKNIQTEQAIQNYLQGILDAKPSGGYEWDPFLKINDKSAREYAKTIVKSIDKNTDDADLAQFRQKLKDAIDRGASESEIRQILADHVKDAPPIPVYIVPTPVNSSPGTSISDWMKQKGVSSINEWAFGKKGGDGDAIKISAPVDVTPTTIKISDIPGPKDQINPMAGDAEILKLSMPVSVTPTSIDFQGLGLALTLANAGIEKFQQMAIKAIDVIAKRIDSLTNLKPDISLQNKLAMKANDAIAKRIDSLESIKPQINLQNNKAIKAVDVVVKRINDINKLHPVVNVKVKYSGVRSFATGGEFDTHGPELIMVGDNPSGREHVKVTPSASGGKYSGTVSSDKPIIINLANTTRIDGTDLINSRALKKMVKLTLGENRDKYM